MKIYRYSLKFISIISVFFISFLLMLFFSINSQKEVEKYKTMGFPIIEINTENGKAIKSKTKYLHADYKIIDEDGNIFETSGKIRGRGNSTWKTFDRSKKSYLIKFNKEVALFSMPAAQKWVLISNIVDKTSLRNIYAFYLGKKVWNRFDWVPNTKFIFITLNGKFLGLYTLSEKIDVHKNHVNITPPSFLAEVSSIEKEPWDFMTKKRVSFTIEKQDGLNSAPDYLPYRKIIEETEETLFGENFKDKTEGWQKYLDESSWVDWYLINELSRNNDSKFLNSCYMVYDAEKNKFFMGPLWDFDIAFGNINYNDCDKTEGWHTNQYDWYKRLFEDSYFVSLVQERWDERKNEFEESIDFLRTQAKNLEEAAEINNLLWATFGKRQWPNAPGYRKRKTYEDEMNYMENWILERAKWIDKTGFSDASNLTD